MTTRPRPLLVISLAAVIWSTSFAVTKVLLDTVPPLTIGALRFTAAALLHLQLANLHGDIAATVPATASSPAQLTVTETTEYGLPRTQPVSSRSAADDPDPWLRPRGKPTDVPQFPPLIVHHAGHVSIRRGRLR